MPPIGMPPPLRRSRRRSTMHPASPVAHRRRPAWRPSPSARSASRRRVHGVHPIGRGHPPPPPPLSTAPTIACPPAATFTCSTTTRCCEPFPRWRFNASIRAAVVRAQFVRLGKALVHHRERLIPHRRELEAPHRRLMRGHKLRGHHVSDPRHPAQSRASRRHRRGPFRARPCRRDHRRYQGDFIVRSAGRGSGAV